MTATNLVLIDNNKLSREGLRAIFSGGDFQVRSHAATLDEALANRNGTPDIGIVLLDANTLRDVGADIPRLRSLYPGAHVVVLTDHVDMPEIGAAIQAGASGILMKDISVEALAQSMRLVMAGEKVFPTQLAGLLLEGRMPSPARIGEGRADRNGLSKRELQILRHLVTGESNKAIAVNLNITEATVKVHLKTLLRKINATNRTQAAIWALNHGLSPEQSPSSDLVA